MIGAIAPWIGVLIFGIGVLLSYSGRPGSLGWMLLVLYVAFAGQVIGGLLFGSSLSAFVGAAVMTPVAVFVATQRTGPPTLVTFLPAFWLLVPGAIALVGVTQVMGEAAGRRGVVHPDRGCDDRVDRAGRGARSRRSVTGSRGCSTGR